MAENRMTNKDNGKWPAAAVRTRIGVAMGGRYPWLMLGSRQAPMTKPTTNQPLNLPIRHEALRDQQAACTNMAAVVKGYRLPTVLVTIVHGLDHSINSGDHCNHNCMPNNDYRCDGYQRG